MCDAMTCVMMSNDALSCVMLSKGHEVGKAPVLDNGHGTERHGTEAHGTHGSTQVCLKPMGRVTYEIAVWCQM